MKRPHAHLLLLLACACVGLDAGPAAAQAFPAQTIRLVSPYAAGGTADQFSRIVQGRLAEALHQPVIVESRPGANSNIGTAAVLSAAADGHTWLVAGPALMANPLLQKGLWDPLKDFTAIGIAGYGPSVIVVPSSLRASTLAELVAMAKAEPGKLNYANPSNGSSSHLNAEMFKRAAGIDVPGVPYKGQAPAITDLVAGRVTFMVLSVGLALPLIEGGRLKPLAAISTERIGSLPQVPTLTEEGYPKGNFVAWFGYAVRSTTPIETQQKINAAFNQLIGMPEVKEKLEQIGLVPAGPRTLAQMQALMQSDYAAYKEIVETAHIKAE